MFLIVPAFTIADLRALLVECGAVPPGVAIDDPATAILDLGVDSVSLLALQILLQERYGIVLDEGSVEHLTTVGSATEHINELIGADRR
jgi:acyl carrier protein